MTTFRSVARTLNSSLDNDTVITGVSPSSAPKRNTLCFVSRWSDDQAEIIANHTETLFIVPSEPEMPPGSSNVVVASNPRLAYALVLREHFAIEAVTGISPTAVVAATASVGQGATIREFAVVGDGVVVGDRCDLGSHSVLYPGVRVGSDTTIGSHTVIGGAGFGFELDADGTPVRIQHLGGAEIGCHVEIGQHVVIAQGTVEPTIVGDHVKIDDCVFIAHNVIIGDATFVIAGAEISGGVRVGRRVWISPEASIINKVTIGDDALVGIGAVVVRDVATNTVVAGVPATPRGLRHER